MYNDGYENITSMDISQQVVKQMLERFNYAEYKMGYVAENVLNMSFPDSSFDIVIDKALLDSILCAENANPTADKMMEEVYRVLKPGGRYICISHGDEKRRMLYFVYSYNYRKSRIGRLR